MIEPGQSYPLGATVQPDGVNFSVYSRSGTGVELLLFDHADDSNPSQSFTLDPAQHRTGDYWHAFIPGLKSGQLYAYRVDGPYEPEEGHRFDRSKLLLDPYGRSVAMPKEYNRKIASQPGRDNTGQAAKSVVVDTSTYDWEDDAPLQHPFSRTVIYEMHVKGFTRNPNSGVDAETRGTYAGLIEKIPYLQDLGITAVELLPVFHFDEDEAPLGRKNYWGYTPMSLFAPHMGYSSTQDPMGAVDEFRDMVKALHRAGIEVILDVVYNHTAEGSRMGPTFCFKGFENRTYYILEADRKRYANYSGTGNTLNANAAVVRRMIRDSLHYWVTEMHVDGFRFDLASILSRDSTGQPLANPPVLLTIETDPVFAGTKLIAEAWDAGGLYQVGHFIGDHWKEWNGQFRDDVRSFVRSERGMVPKISDRFLASPDVYGHKQREPEQSINFVTAHDGFTLNDLVSYNEKHNAENGEDNRDGHNDNRSWNCGVEGPTEDAEVEALRVRQIKNFFTINLLALGVPMILMGDEVRRTQGGNNNAYCQDNEISWFDWSLLEQHEDIYRFVRELINLRLTLDIFRGDHGLNLQQLLQRANIQWHGQKLNQPDWGDESRFLAFTLQTRQQLVHVILNAYWEPLVFELPPVVRWEGTRWQRLIDTSLPTGIDFCKLAEAPVIRRSTYKAHPRSIVVLVAESESEL